MPAGGSVKCLHGTAGVKAASGEYERSIRAGLGLLEEIGATGHADYANEAAVDDECG